jgi:hypothetical protein
MDRLMAGSTSPLSGGLLAAKAGKTSIENKRTTRVKGIEILFILQPPLAAIFRTTSYRYDILF